MKNRNKIVEDNLGLVHHCLRNLIHIPSDQYEDCFQEGCIGLCKAAERFDESTGNRFSTYAIPWITGYIRMYLRNNHPIKIPRPILDLNYKIERLREDGLDDNEIASKLNLSVLEFREASGIFDIQSFDQPLDDDCEGFTLKQFVGIEPESNEVLLEEAIFQIVKEITSKASERDRGIYEDHLYSRMYGEPMTQMELSGKYGLSQMQVGRVIRRYDRLLKEKLDWR